MQPAVNSDRETEALTGTLRRRQSGSPMTSSAAIRAGCALAVWQEQLGPGTACHCRQVVAPELAGSLDRMQNSLPSGSASVIQPLPSGRR
jgi:hypothetical protein